MSAEEFASADEQLVGRELEKELRAGVEHYKPGQHEAVIYPWTQDYFTKEPQQIGRITLLEALKSLHTDASHSELTEVHE